MEKIIINSKDLYRRENKNLIDKLDFNLIKLISNRQLLNSADDKFSYIKKDKLISRLFFKKQNIIEIIVNKLNERNADFFIDQYFPPSDKSLYYNKSKKKIITGQEDLEAYNNEKIWISLSKTLNEDSEYFMKENFIINESIGPDEIQQGKLSDCYYLSSMASLSKEPELIAKLFPIINIDKIKEFLRKGKNPLDSKYLNEFFIEYVNFSKDDKKGYFQLLYK